MQWGGTQGQRDESCCPSQGCPTYPWGCVLQVCGVHCCAQCYRARLCLLQVLLHLHQAQLQVHSLAFLSFAFFIYLLQPLLQTLVCRKRNLGACWEPGELLRGSGHILYIFLGFYPKRDVAPALVQSGLYGLAQSTRFPPSLLVPEGPGSLLPLSPEPQLGSIPHIPPCPAHPTCAATKHFLQLPPLLAQLGELSSDLILLLLQPLLLLREPSHLCLCPVLAQFGLHCSCWKHSPPTTSSVRGKNRREKTFPDA
uniref:Uncharacterized protein n=1 Tax=Junco hyemalis TaxID=40217 RepID=A0A8C5NN82_JUNHY